MFQRANKTSATTSTKRRQTARPGAHNAAHSALQQRRPLAHGLLVLALGFGFGCSDNTSLEASTNETSARFEWVDVSTDSGVNLTIKSGDPRRWYIVEGNGSGAAWLDYDSDGDQDLFVANGSSLRYIDDGQKLEALHDGRSSLYRNDGNWKFTDVGKASGAEGFNWVNGVATGDIDNDGDTDLYLACYGKDVLLRNDAGHFVDATDEAKLGCELWGSHATFGDANKDGNLDLFVSNYVQFDLESPPDGGQRANYDGVQVGWGPEAENKQGFNVGAPNRFYMGNGKGQFSEATEEAGLQLHKALCSYAAVFSDVDGDGAPDILVANDLQPCNLFLNQGNGRFQEEGVRRGFAFDGIGKATSAMGLAVADVDQDGDLDCLRTNFDMEPNTLHLNQGNGFFKDATEASGLAQNSVAALGWGCAFFDAECDGDLDLMVANGHVMPQATDIGMTGWAMQTQFFECVSSNSTRKWIERTAQAGAGLQPKHSSRGLALADVDDDGDLDAVVIDLDSTPRLLENKAKRAGHWLSVELEGTRSNRDGFGARIFVLSGEQRWTREARSTDGLYSGHDTRYHFGLGNVERIDAVEVHWPSGAVSRVETPTLDQRLSVVEPEKI